MQAISEASQEASREDPEETAHAMAEMIKKPWGSLPFVTRMLARRPDMCIATLAKSTSLYANPEIMDPKTAELIAISSAVANRCEFCITAHMEKARSHGATAAEIFHTILISSAICESSAWAVAFREFRKLEGKTKQDEKAKKDKVK